MIPRLAALSTIAVLLFAGVSCDSHSWEETRVLHGHHGDDDHHGEKHEAKDKDDSHGKKDGAH